MKGTRTARRSRGAMVMILASLAMAQVHANEPGAASPASAATPHDGLSAAEQVKVLARQVSSGELSRMSDAEVLAVSHALQPQTLLSWARSELNKFPAYEYRMSRQELVKGTWQKEPSRMFVRYRDSPRQVYAKWLPGGAYAGQEIIYDETRRKDEMYGHLGGILGVASMWIDIDGTIARSQSNHTVLDLGYQFLLTMLERDARSLREAGRSEKFNAARIVQEGGQRMLALTWDLPADAPKYYAKKVELMFDLKKPWPRVVTSWNAKGEMVERIIFDKMVRKTFDASAFDPKNDEYDF